jgi:hypothetical protein
MSEQKIPQTFYICALCHCVLQPNAQSHNIQECYCKICFIDCENEYIRCSGPLLKNGSAETDDPQSNYLFILYMKKKMLLNMIKSHVTIET